MYGVSPFFLVHVPQSPFLLFISMYQQKLDLGHVGGFTRAIHEKKNSYYSYRLGVNHTFYLSINLSINLPLHGRSIFLPECSF